MALILCVALAPWSSVRALPGDLLSGGAREIGALPDAMAPPARVAPDAVLNEMSGPPNPPATPVPLDGGMGLLALAGVAYAAWRLRTPRRLLPSRRGAQTVLALLLVLGASAASAQRAISKLPVTDGEVTSTVLSPDGETLYLLGQFTRVSPVTGSGVRLSLPGGTLVSGNAIVNGRIETSVSDGAGGFYIGGAFTQVGGVTRSRLAHILADGTLDAAFDPNPNGDVDVLTVSGGVLYVGGRFTSIGGQARNHIAAFDTATGTVTAFDPNASSWVYALTVEGGVVYAGGLFSTIGGQTRNRIAALDASTGAATAFDANMTSGYPTTLVVSGGLLYVAGGFSDIGGQARNTIAALDPTTGAATAFDPSSNGFVFDFAIDGGVMYVGGTFNTIGGQTRDRIAAIDLVTGAPTAFNPGANGDVRALVVDGGTVYAGGGFTTIGGQACDRIAAIDASTGVVAALNTGPDGTVSSLSTSGSTLYVSGTFTTVGGEARTDVAAIATATGAVTAFDPGANSTITALVPAGGVVYASGAFTTIGGQPRNYLAALDPATGAATAFDPSPSSPVTVLAVDGGTLYAGGLFTTIAGASRSFLAGIDLATGTATPFAVSWGRPPSFTGLDVSGGVLYARGTFRTIGGLSGSRTLVGFDASTGAVVFDPQPDSRIDALEVSGGVVYAGGEFSTIGGQSRYGFAALDAQTGLATALNPTLSNSVRAIQVVGGVVYIGGSFATVTGQTRNRIAALDAATGAVTTFDPNFGQFGGSVNDLTAANGVLYAGGNFQSVGDEFTPEYEPRRGLAGFVIPSVVSQSVAGWRMLSSPVAGLTVGDLARVNLVGGVPGDPSCASGPFNLITGYTGGQTPGGTNGYATPAAYTEALVPGKGFFWYFFGDGSTVGPCGTGATASAVQPLPLTLNLGGASPSADVTATFTAAERVAGDDTFYLIGNPFGEGLDLDGTGAGLSTITATDANGPIVLQNVVQVWDASAAGGSGGYALKIAGADSGTDGSGGTSAADNLSVWQGGWIERTATASPAYPMTLTYGSAYRTGSASSGVFVGRSASAPVEALRFEVSGAIGEQLVHDGAAALVFAEGASAEWDVYDATKLPPLASPAALVAFIGTGRDGERTEKATESLPLDLSGEARIPLAFYTTGAGAFEIRWTGTEALPDEWAFELTDTATGATVDLRASASYGFDAQETADWSRRFTVRVSGRSVASDETPGVTAVGLAYPNPTRGRSTVTVSVAQAEQVQVEVFNVLGQRVLVALDAPLAPGASVPVSMDTSQLASGSYIVRVRGESFAETRRLTVVR